MPSLSQLPTRRRIARSARTGGRASTTSASAGATTTGTTTTGATTAGATAQVRRPRRAASPNLVLSIVCAGVVMASLDLFIVNVALPQMARTSAPPASTACRGC